jgi:L-cysteine:1D-myo-inositol 2-amino-2-deoxy-alpha-D-glucopyranoside ligase
VESWPSPAVPRLADLGFGRAAPPRVRDTATGELQPVEGRDGLVRMYVCGITPYDATHLGHAATYLLFDLVQRACLYAGLEVRYVQNVTDIDDPLLERAVQTGDDWRAIAARETALFRDDMAALRIIAPTEYIGAVEAMPDIVDIVRRLRERGAAYDLDGDVYFSVAAATGFGAVGHYSPDEMLRLSAERGGDPERPGKKDPLDCLLWQAAKPDEPSWDSPLGAGRPGWHVECAAIALRHLGEQIDVNGGGSDLVFPHHELSAAEAQVVTGAAPFARAYLHQAMVGYEGEKMSKSRGNLVFVSRLLTTGVDPMVIRLALLAHRHDTDWEWHDEEIQTATERLTTWRAALGRDAGPPAAPLVAELRAALGDGIDTPRALSAVDAWATEEGDNSDAPGQARAAIDALLGIATYGLSRRRR